MKRFDIDNTTSDIDMNIISIYITNKYLVLVHFNKSKTITYWKRNSAYKVFKILVQFHASTSLFTLIIHPYNHPEK
jgi:hypothetical protein